MKKLWKGLCTIAVFMTVWFCCATSCFAGAELNNGTFKYEADFTIIPVCLRGIWGTIHL